MSSKTTQVTFLLLGGTGKVASRIAPLLSANENCVILASRSGNTLSLPNCHGVKFDWFDQSTYANPFVIGPKICAIFIVAPPIVDQLPLTRTFIELAITHGVKRFVLLSGSVLPVGDGPMMGAVSKYLISLNLEFAILRPTWFMENFSEMEHHRTILEENRIVTAAGNGKVPFVSANDIAAVAFRALTDKAAEMISKSLGRKITHVRISEDEAASQMHAIGIPEDYSRILAQLDTYIAEGKEEIMNDVVYRVTGKGPVRLEDFIQDCVTKEIWVKN